MRYEMFDELIREVKKITLEIVNLRYDVMKTNYKLDQILTKMNNPHKTPEYDERGFEVIDN